MTCDFAGYFCYEQQFPTILQKDAYDFVFLFLSVFEAEWLNVPAIGNLPLMISSN